MNPATAASLTSNATGGGGLVDATMLVKKDAWEQLGTPPFERPVIIQILSAFLEYKYSVKGPQAAKRKFIEKIAKVFITALNRFELPVPAYGDQSYQLNYQRWRAYVRDSKKPMKVSHIFGKSMLKSVMKPLVEILQQQNVFADVVQFVGEFFTELDRELNTENSPIIAIPEAHLSAISAPQMAPLSTQPAPPQLGPQIAPTMPGQIPIVQSTATVPSSTPEETQPRRKRKGAAKSSTNAAEVTPSPVLASRKKQQKQDDQALPVVEAAPTQAITSNYVPQYGLATIFFEQPTPNAKIVNKSTASGVIQVPDMKDLLPELGFETKSRDDKARKEEQQGIIRFELIQNDGIPEHMIYLTAARNIFSKQLPKMPKDYIVRLVFDRGHKSVVLLKGGKVAGGITFRPFWDNGFMEIAFCAVTGTEQVKGYGTHLMNHVKAYCQSVNLPVFLTYADNYAIGYFKKQGFTKTVSLPQKKWVGFIKDYVGGTLMECVIKPNIDYLKVPELIAVQRKAVYDKVKEISRSHVVHKGIEGFKNEKGIVQLDQIPGIRETGWRVPKQTDEELEQLQQILEEVLEKIREHQSSWPFLEPVNPKEVFDYYEVIKDPIDLQTMEKRLKARNYYITKEIFMADLKRMCDNCRIYNREDTEYYKCANDLENEFLKKPRHWRRLDQSVQTPKPLQLPPQTPPVKMEQ